MVEFAESLTIAQTHNLIQKQPQTLKEKWGENFDMYELYRAYSIYAWNLS
jgi:predicted PolB exonuclease-like 3'-5' exonuclease